MNKNIVFAIDNGHGFDKIGNKSVDGTVREWAKAREIADGIVEGLQKRGYMAEFVTPEDKDIPLYQRVARVNAICGKVGVKNVCCVSIHCDAQGYGNYWTNANGWSCFCSIGRKAKTVSRGSQNLANCLYDAAAEIGRNMRKPSPDTKFWTKSLAITRDTLCPAVLTENFFMTNQDDVAFLNSEEGVQKIIDAHIEGLIHYAEIYA